MRQCPTVEGSPAPLIQHRIGADVCLSRQQGFFHKCHRCVYRGQAADWVPPTPVEPLTIEVDGAATAVAAEGTGPTRGKAKKVAKAPKVKSVQKPATAAAAKAAKKPPRAKAAEAEAEA